MKASWPLSGLLKRSGQLAARPSGGGDLTWDFFVFSAGPRSSALAFDSISKLIGP